MSTENVVIIGAGLAGLTLALALHQQSIPATVYESRSAPLNVGGAVMLSPNALRILDDLGLYDNIRTKGYNFDIPEYRDLEGKLVDTYEFGGKQKYGYSGLRIYRHVLIDELVAALAHKGITVQYGRKFSHVVSDTPEGVTFAFTDGTTAATGLLVGADGIHSTVRKHLYKDLSTTFIGMAGITAAVPTAQLKLPPGYHIPVTIISPKGAFVVAPQEPDGSEVLIGKQMRVTSIDTQQTGWEREFVAEKESAIAFLQQGNEAFPEFVRNAVSHIDPAKVNKWPFFVVPKLDRWTSETRRVVILGDAAHAIPPSAGQGINQAFEDVYMLALLLARNDQVGRMPEALRFWQQYRQERIDRIVELNKLIDKRRMPTDDVIMTEGSGTGTEDFDLSWLYSPNLRHDVEKFLGRSDTVE
ncbi:salicylate hydroxylase [Purpureocillium lavendulum]|uniref:Salicylate hydroxylase n=1 Tax=Purpureocillium lavendulum TaxID=1247861 RepID=A0AB34FDX0_9HYPO|nr:salicylate hydroxylase [Purpureocillium lavendulum]